MYNFTRNAGGIEIFRLINRDGSTAGHKRVQINGYATRTAVCAVLYAAMCRTLQEESTSESLEVLLKAACLEKVGQSDTFSEEESKNTVKTKGGKEEAIWWVRKQKNLARFLKPTYNTTPEKKKKNYKGVGATLPWVSPTAPAAGGGN